MVINSKLNAIRRPDAIDTPILRNSNYNFGNQIKNKNFGSEYMLMKLLHHHVSSPPMKIEVSHVSCRPFKYNVASSNLGNSAGLNF